ncbi:MAG: hypothetical protein N2C14_07560 [Planctomycetales bacterium]
MDQPSPKLQYRLSDLLLLTCAAAGYLALIPWSKGVMRRPPDMFAEPIFWLPIGVVVAASLVGALCPFVVAAWCVWKRLALLAPWTYVLAFALAFIDPISEPCLLLMLYASLAAFLECWWRGAPANAFGLSFLALMGTVIFYVGLIGVIHRIA